MNATYVNLNFTDYNDERIKYYDFDWTTTKDGVWNVTKVRGVNNLIMTHSNLTVNQEIILFEEKWLMDIYLLSFISSLAVLVVLCVTLKLWAA